MKPSERSCVGCVFHIMPAELGGDVHLCLLPPDCAPAHAHIEDERGDEVEGRTYLGTSCDVMRRMGAACGPHAAMRLDAHKRPASQTSEGRDA